MSSVVRLVVSLAALAVSAQAAIGPTGNLIVTNKVMAPDGFTRSAIEFGPLIKANTGENFRINVINKLTDKSMPVTTSIHWHGLFQRGSSWADGGAFATQCPIIPGESFEYAFKADHPGTFWYHSHVEAQYCDGLRGPLVIYNPNDPYKHLYDVDDESTIITLTDWFHQGSNNRTAAKSTLINGLGRYKDDPTNELAVVNVERGKRYRFRLVSMSCDANFKFSIDGHKMTIIEADGEYTQPLEVDEIRIFAGQRYSMIFRADQQPGNYWIRADPHIGETGFEHGINSAVLRYKGAAIAEPTTSSNTNKPLRETDLHPKENPAAPGRPAVGGADIRLILEPSFNNGTKRWQINGTSFHPETLPTLPTMLQILSGSQRAQDLLPKGSVFTLERNKVVEVVIRPVKLGGPHPMHLHGHAFSVVRSAGSSSYNFENPIRRDVVSTGLPEDDDEVTIRFTTDNPGPWFLHCHVDWHMLTGFAIVFAEDVPNIRNNAPPAWNELCPKYERFLEANGSTPNAIPPKSQTDTQHRQGGFSPDRASTYSKGVQRRPLHARPGGRRPSPLNTSVGMAPRPLRQRPAYWRPRLHNTSVGIGPRPLRPTAMTTNAWRRPAGGWSQGPRPQYTRPTSQFRKPWQQSAGGWPQSTVPRLHRGGPKAHFGGKHRGSGWA